MLLEGRVFCEKVIGAKPLMSFKAVVNVNHKRPSSEFARAQTMQELGNIWCLFYLFSAKMQDWELILYKPINILDCCPSASGTEKIKLDYLTAI